MIFKYRACSGTGNLRQRIARGVLRHPGKACLLSNVGGKFSTGATVRFSGAILDGYAGSRTCNAPGR